jgi:hypothetical protein
MSRQDILAHEVINKQTLHMLAKHSKTLKLTLPASKTKRRKLKRIFWMCSTSMGLALKVNGRNLMGPVSRKTRESAYSPHHSHFNCPLTNISNEDTHTKYACLMKRGRNPTTAGLRSVSGACIPSSPPQPLWLTSQTNAKQIRIVESISRCQTWGPRFLHQAGL